MNCNNYNLIPIQTVAVFRKKEIWRVSIQISQYLSRLYALAGMRTMTLLQVFLALR